MKLIEKKCPNCGASLEFENDAKSCKCEYCRRSFVIERESNDKDFYNPNNYTLEAAGSLKSIFVVSFIVIFLFSIFIITTVFTHGNNSGLFGNDYKKELYTEVSEFSNSELSEFDIKSYWIIEKKKDGLHDYSLELNPTREKIYVASNKKGDKNLVIVVYKAKYYIFGNNENTYEIYVPIIFENLEKDDIGISFQLENGHVKADEYYFNLEHSEYAYGYQDMDAVEKKVIEPLKKDYKISK